jgi:hypothetical protein
MERVRRPEQPDALGLVYDLLVQFAVAGTAATLGFLIRSIRSYLASQPDREQRVLVTVGDRTVELKAAGMTDEEMAELEDFVNTWMRRMPEA